MKAFITSINLINFLQTDFLTRHLDVTTLRDGLHYCLCDLPASTGPSQDVPYRNKIRTSTKDQV